MSENMPMGDAASVDAQAGDFKDAYHTLKSNAALLERGDVVDIDNLMAVVESSIAAYKVCQTRIDALEQALKSAFDEVKD